MSASHSELPKDVMQGYWRSVLQLLHTRHNLSEAKARRAIRVYQSVLACNGIGDILYHATPEETAIGVIQGGHAQDPTGITPLPSKPAVS